MTNNIFWSDGIAELQPYLPGEQSQKPNIIKLNSNESPYPPAPEVAEAIRQAATDSLQKYPQFGSEDLLEVVARYHGLQKNQIFAGNGSDEVLAHLFRALLKHAGRKIVFTDLSYSFYPVYSRFFEVDYDLIPLKDDFTVDMDALLQLDPAQVSAILLTNPNAPTGILLPPQQIEELLQAQPEILVVVDEAYVDFAADGSCISLINKYPNLIVAQTVSKSRSLAGIRVGFAFAQQPLIEALLRVKDSFNSYPVDSVAQAAATASFKAEEYFRDSLAKVVRSRDSLSSGLQELGFEVLPSQSNFVFARHPDLNAQKLQQFLRARDIMVRHFTHPRSAEFLRITVGRDDECEALLQGIKAYINGNDSNT